MGTELDEQLRHIQAQVIMLKDELTQGVSAFVDAHFTALYTLIELCGDGHSVHTRQRAAESLLGLFWNMEDGPWIPGSEDHEAWVASKC